MSRLMSASVYVTRLGIVLLDPYRITLPLLFLHKPTQKPRQKAGFGLGRPFAGYAR